MGMSTSTLRYYDKARLLPFAERSAGGCARKSRPAEYARPAFFGGAAACVLNHFLLA